MTPLVNRMFDALDARVGARGAVQEAATKVFPRHWSFLLGEAAVVCFVVLVLTGVFLSMFYRPSIEPVTYAGEATLFQGRALPEAFASVVRIVHDVPGGSFVHRLHTAASHVFVAVILLHFLRVLLTGAFRRPRELNYHLGILLLLLAIGAAYTGHKLPFDVTAGNAMRILYSILLSIPFAGEFVAQWVFGGEFPTGDIIPRLYAVHIVVLPALIAMGMAAHVGLVVRQTHTQFPRPGVDTTRKVAGEPAWPWKAASSAVTALAVVSLLALSSVFIPWGAVDLHGPYIVAQVTNASQPDWFLFWVEGAVRLYPGVEPSLLGTTLTMMFVPGVVLPTVLGALLFAYPWIEGRVVGPPREGDHHELQRPTDIPFRVGFVAAMSALLGVLFVTASHDVIARLLGMPLETLTWGLRVAVLALPPVVGVAAARYARHARDVRKERW